MRIFPTCTPARRPLWSGARDRASPPCFHKDYILSPPATAPSVSPSGSALSVSASELPRSILPLVRAIFPHCVHSSRWSAVVRAILGWYCSESWKATFAISRQSRASCCKCAPCASSNLVAVCSREKPVVYCKSSRKRGGPLKVSAEIPRGKNAPPRKTSLSRMPPTRKVTAEIPFEQKSLPRKTPSPRGAKCPPTQKCPLARLAATPRLAMPTHAKMPLHAQKLPGAPTSTAALAGTPHHL